MSYTLLYKTKTFKCFLQGTKQRKNRKQDQLRPRQPQVLRNRENIIYIWCMFMVELTPLCLW